MGKTEQFDICDDSASLTVSDTGRKKIKGFYVSRGQAFVILFFLILIVITVALLATYLGPRRQSYFNERKGKKIIFFYNRSFAMS